ncbi:MAG: adenylate kinase [Bacilli bacterium]|nr:adenylate kinase [Bacilli bacterium]
MIILITGTTHSGKTLLAQRLLEKYQYPYLSIDHLKMGLIRSHNTNLTPLSSDKDLTDYLWPIVKEIIKTAIENKQNLIIEGCYIPLDWQKDFTEIYLENIKFYCIIMSEEYIKKNFNNILEYANIIENRIDDQIDIEELIKENKRLLDKAQKNNIKYILIDDRYEINVE